MIKHISNYILCPQLVVKTKYIGTLIKLLLIYLITYYMLTSSGQGRQLLYSFANQVQRQKAMIRRMDFRKPGLKMGLKMDIWNRLAIWRILQHTPIRISRVTPLSQPMSNRVSFIIDLLLNVLMAALFFRIKRHCGAIAERRLDCKSPIIFLFLKFPYGTE